MQDNLVSDTKLVTVVEFSTKKPLLGLRPEPLDAGAACLSEADA